MNQLAEPKQQKRFQVEEGTLAEKELKLIKQEANYEMVGGTQRKKK